MAEAETETEAEAKANSKAKAKANAKARWGKFKNSIKKAFSAKNSVGTAVSMVVGGLLIAGGIAAIATGVGAAIGAVAIVAGVGVGFAPLVADKAQKIARSKYEKVSKESVKMSEQRNIERAMEDLQRQQQILQEKRAQRQPGASFVAKFESQQQAGPSPDVPVAEGVSEVADVSGAKGDARSSVEDLDAMLHGAGGLQGTKKVTPDAALASVKTHGVKAESAGPQEEDVDTGPERGTGPSFK